MKLFIVDTIGPFFKGYNKYHYNWSKIPFDKLENMKIFKDGLTVEEALGEYQKTYLSDSSLNKLLIFFHLADEVIKELLGSIPFLSKQV